MTASYHFHRNLRRAWLNNNPVPVNSNKKDGEGGKVKTAELYDALGFTQDILERQTITYRKNVERKKVYPG